MYVQGGFIANCDLRPIVSYIIKRHLATEHQYAENTKTGSLPSRSFNMAGVHT